MKHFLIVDTQYIAARGIESILTLNFKDKINAFIACDHSEAIRIIRIVEVDVIFLDNNFIKDDNIDFIRFIKKWKNKIKIYIFFDNINLYFSSKYNLEQVDGFLNKCEKEYYLNNLIDRILMFIDNPKYRIVPSKKNIYTIHHRSVAVLSEREEEIATLLTKGYRISEIATKLSLNSSTVSTYKIRIFGKLNIDNIVSLSEIISNT